ncbi:unnamed protein product [Larinioides sclopetarius]|uniref:Uncharacterized protein n=1 Tax=Larinioides sclopetarius TaxID=280406 RepID=A0AAV1ZLE9_9ARAC
MKILLVCLIGSLCVLSTLGERTRCYSQSDCNDNECCTGGISPWIKGHCQDFSQEGEACDPGQPDTGKYFLYCPCRDGLVCDNSGKTMGSIKCVKN